MRRKFIAALCAGTALMVGFASHARADSTVVVTPSSMGDWAFDNRDVNGTVGADSNAGGSMVTGPATPPLGLGSANLFAGNGSVGGDGAGELRNTGFAGTLLSSLTSLSYSTYLTNNAPNNQQFPYLGLTISYTDLGTPTSDVLFFEPPYQTAATGNPSLPDQGPTLPATWQTWNALEGGWWDNNGVFNPGTGVDFLADFIAQFPDATIENADGTGLGGVRFDVGFADANDQFNGNVDNFTIGTSAGATTFDFEPDSTVPEPASFALLGVGLAALGRARRRRRA